MGRYYFGDIEGKFMFAVQSSHAADRFGVTGVSPRELHYYFNKEDDLENVEKELAAIKNLWGKDLENTEEFFNIVNTYTEKSLADFLLSKNPDFEENKVIDLLSDYADYTLGCKIRDYLIEHGDCSFTAEC